MPWRLRSRDSETPGGSSWIAIQLPVPDDDLIQGWNAAVVQQGLLKGQGPQTGDIALISCEARVLNPALTDFHVSCMLGDRWGCVPDVVLIACARSGAAVALRKGKSNWLFDCGEDTQRQLLKQALVRPGKIDRIFVTRASGDCAFGLPGMAPLAMSSVSTNVLSCSGHA